MTQEHKKPQSIFIVTRHYGCSYCNSEAYEEASEEITVFDSEKKATRFVEEEKRITHEENCDDGHCMCDYSRRGNHGEWDIAKYKLQ